LPGEDFTLDVNRIIVGKTDITDSPESSFYGNFVNFYFDGERLFDRLDAESPATPPTPRPGTVTPPPEPPSGTLAPTRPITFPPHYIHHIRISVSQLGADARIRLLFRTEDPNGLLVYTSRSGGNFLAVELVDGRLVAVSNDGSGPRYVDTIRYDTRCYFNMCSKADISQLNLPHGTDN